MQFAAKLNSFLEEYGKTHILTGVLEVRQRDTLLYQKYMGMADYERQIPFAPDSVFTFYSISKPFCALGVMKLWDRGLVDLDVHPSRYVPEAAGLHGDVTLRHLLQHTSGLPDFEQTGDFAKAHAPGTPDKLREHLTLIGSYPQQFAPGTGHFYANINYVLLSLVIENRTGLDYGDYMCREVFAPLGMTGAKVDVPGGVVPGHVQGYRSQEGRLVPVAKSHNWMRGAGDIVGTAADLYRLNVAIKERSLLSERAWEQILTPSPVNGFGFGCTVSPWHNRTRIQHNGGHTGFRTLHIQVPEDDFDLILLSNFGGGNVRADVMEAAGTFFYQDAETDDSEMDKGYI